MIERECIAAARGLPSESCFRKPAFSGLFREVQVDAIEAFPKRRVLVSIGLRHVVLLGMWRWREGDGEERREIYIAILEDEVQVEVNV